MVKGLSFFPLFSGCFIEKESEALILWNIKMWTAISYCKIVREVSRIKRIITPYKCYCRVVSKYDLTKRFYLYLNFIVTSRTNSLVHK